MAVARLLLLVVAASFPTFAALTYFVVWAHTPWMKVLYAASKVVQAALPLLGWWALGMERRPGWAARPSGRSRAALAGLISGGAIGGVVLAAFAGPLPAWLPLAEVARRIHERLVDLGAATPLRFLLLALGLSVVHSLFEEYYWRWFFFGQLQLRLPLPAALTLAGLAFASHHWIVVDSFLGGEHRLAVTLPLTLTVAAGGAWWGWLFQRHRSLLAPWLSHLLVDGALMAVGWQLVKSAM
jgi:membrane protease YdiL (CAAX protease family)